MHINTHIGWRKKGESFLWSRCVSSAVNLLFFLSLVRISFLFQAVRWKISLFLFVVRPSYKYQSVKVSLFQSNRAACNTGISLFLSLGLSPPVSGWLTVVFLGQLEWWSGHSTPQLPPFAHTKVHTDTHSYTVTIQTLLLYFLVFTLKSYYRVRLFLHREDRSGLLWHIHKISGIFLITFFLSVRWKN